MTRWRLAYVMRYQAWPAVRPWAPFVAVLLIAMIGYLHSRRDRISRAELKRATDRAEIAELREAKTHALLMNVARRVDSLQGDVDSATAEAQRWHGVALGAAKLIEQQVSVVQRLNDSLAQHPPVTLRDTAAAALQRVAVLEGENASLHNEHDALSQENGALKLALTATQKQVQLVRAAVQSAVDSLEASRAAFREVRQALAKATVRCSSGIPFVPCPSRKKAYLAGILTDEIVRFGLRRLANAT